jgi:DNA-binding Lrp family transcriptional regulator
MNKKDKVREYLATLEDKAKFTLRSVAGALKVDVKDVSNVVRELKALGVVTGEVKTGDTLMTYTVVGNLKAAVTLKNFRRSPLSRPRGDVPTPSRQMRLLSPEAWVEEPRAKPRAKRRTPFVMAIDAEIKRLEERITLLRKTRKEFE